MVVDDVDRLSGSEIRDMFKLIRLTANFPNIVYIVGPATGIASKRLSTVMVWLEETISARSSSFPSTCLRSPASCSSSKLSTRSKLLWTVSTTQVRFTKTNGRTSSRKSSGPLIRNIRDLRRYCVAVLGTAHSLKGEVACQDMLALEAVRLFLPDVFLHLPATQHELTASPGAKQIDKDFHTGFASLLNSSDADRLPSNPRIDAIIKAGKPAEQIVRSLILRLFPQAAHFLPGDNHVPDFNPSEMLLQRRLGHELVLRLYLERGRGPRTARCL